MQLEKFREIGIFKTIPQDSSSLICDDTTQRDLCISFDVYIFYNVNYVQLQLVFIVSKTYQKTKNDIKANTLSTVCLDGRII
jgi:hypothetical protein